MDYSKRLDTAVMFQVPSSYQPPLTAEELAIDTEYPNMNAVQYRLNEEPPGDVLHSFLEVGAMFSNGNVILAGNDYVGRRWGSSFYGWETVDTVLQWDKVAFKKQCEFTITALKCSAKDSNLFLLGNDRGTVELWSTSAAGRGDGFSLHQIDSVNEHIEAVFALDVFHGDDRHAVSGTNDGCLKIWDYGVADLQSLNTMAYAHTNQITGVSTSATQASLFVSCSRDYSSLLWDMRLPRPATALYDKHTEAFTAIHWTSTAERDELVALGDEAGRVHFVDTRKPNEFLKTVDVFPRKIHKISFNQKYFAVLGNTSEVKFYDDQSELMHLDNSATNTVRDIIWKKLKDNDLAIACWIVGWDTSFLDIEITLPTANQAPGDEIPENN